MRKSDRLGVIVAARRLKFILARPDFRENIDIKRVGHAKGGF
jgi:hypothetical protein